MSDQIQLPVLIAGLQTKVDGSVKITLETQELSTDHAGQLYGMRNALACVAIAPDKMQTPNIPKTTPDPDLATKTPSQRLRSVMYPRWKTTNKGFADFDTWYKREMERLINEQKGYLE